METKHANLPASAYPFTLQAIDRNGAVVWTAVVTKPTKFYVPHLADKFGPVAIRMSFADGTTTLMPAPERH
jgi:hypothetical protein